MDNVNFKSDFDFLIIFQDHEGKEMEWPRVDWSARIYAAGTDMLTISHIGGKLRNCFDDRGRIHVVFDNHSLLPEELHADFTYLLPDDNFPDGTRKVHSPEILKLELVRTKSAIPTSAEAKVILPFIKGEPGDTPERVADVVLETTGGAQFKVPVMSPGIENIMAYSAKDIPASNVIAKFDNPISKDDLFIKGECRDGEFKEFYVHRWTRRRTRCGVYSGVDNRFHRLYLPDGKRLYSSNPAWGWTNLKGEYHKMRFMCVATRIGGEPYIQIINFFKFVGPYMCDYDIYRKIWITRLNRRNIALATPGDSAYVYIRLRDAYRTDNFNYMKVVFEVVSDKNGKPVLTKRIE